MTVGVAGGGVGRAAAGRGLVRVKGLGLGARDGVRVGWGQGWRQGRGLVGSGVVGSK